MGKNQKVVYYLFGLVAHGDTPQSPSAEILNSKAEFRLETKPIPEYQYQRHERHKQKRHKAEREVEEIDRGRAN